jgi:hypothetical protein
MPQANAHESGESGSGLEKGGGGQQVEVNEPEDRA